MPAYSPALSDDFPKLGETVSWVRILRGTGSEP